MQEAQKARSARPQRVKTRGVPSGYVEGLNDVRTKSVDLFSLLLDCLHSYVTLSPKASPETWLRRLEKRGRA
jgi:hypothetical protein